MGEMTQLERHGHQLRRVRAALELALKNAETQALYELANGMSEAAVARTLGVDRMTVRKWAGKR